MDTLEFSPQKDNKGLAVAALVLRIVALAIGSITCSILAIVFGAKGKTSTRQGMATAGLVMGIIALPWAIIFKIITFGVGLLTF
jgi:hypothetical protein